MKYVCSIIVLISFFSSANTFRDSIQVTNLYKEASELHDNDKLTEAIHLLDSGITIATQLNSDYLILTGVTKLQKYFIQYDLYEELVELEKLYEERINRLGDPEVYFNFYMHIAIAHDKLGKQQYANEIYHKILPIAQTNNLREQEVVAQLNIALNYIGNKDKKVSFDQLKIARRTATLYGDHHDILYVYGGYISYYEEFNKSDSCLIYIDSARNLMVQKNIKDTYFRSWLNNVALTHLKEIGDYQRAGELAEVFIKEATFEEARDAIFKYYQTAQWYYEHIGDQEKFVDALKSYALIQDSLYEYERKRYLEGLGHVRLILKETEEYKNREKLLSIEQSKYRLLLAFWVSTSIAVILALIMFYVRLKKMKNRNKVLKEESVKITDKLQKQEKELTFKTMLSVQQFEKIRQIHSKVKKLCENEDNINGPEILKDLKEVRDAGNQSIWHEFEQTFLSIHRNFHARLSDAFPNLTPNERKLCAFIKLGMSIHDMSQITGQSQNSIRIARTRLRKKLGLTNSETSLHQWISKY